MFHVWWELIICIQFISAISFSAIVSDTVAHCTVIHLIVIGLVFQLLSQSHKKLQSFESCRWSFVSPELRNRVKTPIVESGTTLLCSLCTTIFRVVLTMRYESFGIWACFLTFSYAPILNQFQDFCHPVNINCFNFFCQMLKLRMCCTLYRGTLRACFFATENTTKQRAACSFSWLDLNFCFALCTGTDTMRRYLDGHVCKR